MDFDTRDQYRRAVERIARQSRRAETDVAELALELAGEASLANTTKDRRAHIGYYLNDKAVSTLEKRAGSRSPVRDPMRRTVFRWPNFFYIGRLTVLTAA